MEIEQKPATISRHACAQKVNFFVLKFSLLAFVMWLLVRVGQFGFCICIFCAKEVLDVVWILHCRTLWLASGSRMTHLEGRIFTGEFRAVELSFFLPSHHSSIGTPLWMETHQIVLVEPSIEFHFTCQHRIKPIYTELVCLNFVLWLNDDDDAMATAI